MSRGAKSTKAKVGTRPTGRRNSLTNEASRRRELEKRPAEALEQQTATSEILRVISSSPTDVQPVLDTVAESAARLCESFDSAIWRRDGDRLLLVAHHGPILVGPIGEFSLPLIRGTVAGRSVVDGRTVHLADAQSEADEFPESWENARRMGFRTILSVTLMREAVAIGSIQVRRTEARLFTERQVALLETFADQAVIALANVRLFKALEDRNRELTETLERQTATSEILRVISSSPTDVQPVLDAVAENAARLCGAEDVSILEEHDGVFRVVATRGASRLYHRGLVTGRHDRAPEQLLHAHVRRDRGAWRDRQPDARGWPDGHLRRAVASRGSSGSRGARGPGHAGHGGPVQPGAGPPGRGDNSDRHRHRLRAGDRRSHRHRAARDLYLRG
jgi:hypothetical protein